MTNKSISEVVEEFEPILDMAAKYQTEHGYPGTLEENKALLTQTLTTDREAVREEERQRIAGEIEAIKVTKPNGLNHAPYNDALTDAQQKVLQANDTEVCEK